ncbi:MAG: ABC transporter permease [Actinomycetota bacterium]|nr:ABC transporter permease [Actinomycetota bacterium]
MSKLSELVAGRELLANLVLRELRSKYKRSVLGWAWSLANPLASMLVFTIVFRVFLKIAPPLGDPSGLHNFALFLLCGLLPWNFFGNSLSGSIGVIVGNASLVKKVYFPRSLLVFASVGSWTTSFLIELVVLLVALLIAGNFVVPWLPVLLVIVAVLMFFIAGVALIFSAANVYFRDVEHLVGVALQVWFYATPVVYPISLVPERLELAGRSLPVRFLYELNPMVGFVEAIRDAVYDLRFPGLGDFAYLVGVSGLVFVGGLTLFSRLERRMAEEI